MGQPVTLLGVLRRCALHIDVILADPADRALVGGLRHLSAPLPEIGALPFRPETTFNRRK